MHFFAENAYEREYYKNSFNFSKLLENTENISRYKSNYYYNPKHEYVVLWYKHKIQTYTNSDNSLVHIDIVLADLTAPIYMNATGDNIYDSYITISIPINFLHKMPFGSIWKDGQSTERFSIETFDINVTENYEVYSIYKALTTQKLAKKPDYNSTIHSTPFDFKSYFNQISEKDRNQLINIKYDNKDFVVHPLLLFITLYGYSMDIKRILCRYSIDDINKKLLPHDQQIIDIAKEKNILKFVILPKGLTHRDAVFLYHYKYDEKLKILVRRLHNKIQLNKKDEKEVIKIDFWHKPTKIKLKGIRIKNKILCTSIIGISEPEGDPIHVFLQPKKNVNFNTNKCRGYSIISRSYKPPTNIENLDFVRDPVNNIIQSVLKEKLEKLSNLRDITLIRPEIDINPIGADTNLISYPDMPDINSVSVGSRQGAIGNTGYANCFFDVGRQDDSIEILTRFDKIWNDALIYAKDNNIKVEWFTYNKGFKSSNDYCLMSLSNFHMVEYELDLPKNVFIIRVQQEGQIYFILEFGQDVQKNKKDPKNYSGLVYKQDKNENFVKSKEGLSALLLKVIEQQGVISSDFIDCYHEKLAIFLHRENENSNWVKNAVERFKK